MLPVLVGFGLEASRFRFVAEWYFIGVSVSLPLLVCAVWCVRRLNEVVRIGQIRLFHRQRGVVEVELDVGNTLRTDAGRIARWTKDIDDPVWHDHRRT